MIIVVFKFNHEDFETVNEKKTIVKSGALEMTIMITAMGFITVQFAFIPPQVFFS